MHVESAECGVSPLSCDALPISVNHARSAELILQIAPAKSHDNVRLVWVACRTVAGRGWVDFGVGQMEGSGQTRFGENHSRKIRLLQKLDETARHCRVVSAHIKKNSTAVPNQHDVSWFVFKFGVCGESGIIQDFPQINRAIDRGESMIGDNKDIGRFTQSLLT